MLDIKTTKTTTPKAKPQDQTQMLASYSADRQDASILSSWRSDILYGISGFRVHTGPSHIGEYFLKHKDHAGGRCHAGSMDSGQISQATRLKQRGSRSIPRRARDMQPLVHFPVSLRAHQSGL